MKLELIDEKIVSSTTFEELTFKYGNKTIMATRSNSIDDNIGQYDLEINLDEDNSDSLTEEETEKINELLAGGEWKEKKGLVVND